MGVAAGPSKAPVKISAHAERSMAATSSPSGGSLGRVALLLFCVVGIYTAYLTQGIVSEHLAMKRYGPQQERFSFLEALNGAQSLCCFVWAWLILQAMVLTGQIKAQDTATWHEYWQAGVTNSIGPAFGMVALKNITYSAQVLVKSCKMVPVMVGIRPVVALLVGPGTQAVVLGWDVKFFQGRTECGNDYFS